MKNETRTDSIPVGATGIDKQGFLHDTPVVTSTGIFKYTKPDGSVRRELRLPEHIFSKESLASYMGKPIIITHEAGFINKENVMQEIVGTILTEGFRDGDDVRCKIVIHDIDKVKKIPYRELSLGYNLDLVEEPGEWNGEPYDAVQTNIRINHLAIVQKARAGDQAHLNLDGKSGEVDDKNKNEGGNEGMPNNEMNSDSIDMTPEELLEAIKNYKASKSAGDPGSAGTPQPEAADGNAAPVKPDPVTAPGEPAAPPAGTAPNLGKEKENHDSDMGKLIAAVKDLIAALEGRNSSAQEPVAADGADESACIPEDNDDSSDDLSQSMNNDSADDFHERLNICRVGDRIRLDGLEDKPIMEAKKAIIAKVIPGMRLDGKSDAYVDAAYDMAVGEIDKRRGVEYQKKQMAASTSAMRTDGVTASMAASARQRMIEREGGKE